MEDSPQILVIIGSESDRERIAELPLTLDWFGISYRLEVSSAHRLPHRTVELAITAEQKGCKVVIAAAGMAAHLPGVVAAYTPLPVIGLPLDASPLRGTDALFSIVQMPPGVPVATVGIDAAVNAAVLAAKIIALSDPEVALKLEQFIASGCKIS